MDEILCTSLRFFGAFLSNLSMSSLCSRTISDRGFRSGRLRLNLWFDAISFHWQTSDLHYTFWQSFQFDLQFSWLYTTVKCFLLNKAVKPKATEPSSFTLHRVQLDCWSAKYCQQLASREFEKVGISVDLFYLFCRAAKWKTTCRADQKMFSAFQAVNVKQKAKTKC